METDTPSRITLAQAREAIRLLYGHPTSGYEWECNGCFDLRYPAPGRLALTYEEVAAICPHQRPDDAPISRLDVLAILDRVGA